MSLALIENSGFNPLSSSLEECITELSRYGRPHLAKTDRGWWVYMDVFVTGEGVKFEVKSKSSAATPHAAACGCYDRLIASIKLIKET